MHAVPHIFRPHDLVGGGLALDFVNTVTARDSTPADWIADYAALLQWAGLTGAFARKDLAALASLAEKDSARATAALSRARALREVLCRVVYATIEGRAPSPQDLAALDDARLQAARAARLTPSGGRLAAAWRVERSGLDFVAHVVTARALAFLEHAPGDRLRVCDGHDCGWVFVDTSKNGRRRWCEMATCGNTAKAERFAGRRA